MPLLIDSILAGLRVATSADAEEAVRIIQHGRFDAIVLSYTLPNRTIRYLPETTPDYCPEPLSPSQTRARLNAPSILTQL
jgi:hypothetical protein